MIITIPTFDGESVNLDVNSVQFFWQKLGQPLVTQIVCNTAENTAKRDSCVYLAGSVFPKLNTWNTHGEFIPGRFIVETLTSLDDLREQISITASVTEFLILRRLYTRTDNRVVIPYPSECINNLLKHFVHAPNSTPRHTSHWECNVGGGGNVNDCPTWWLHTHHGFGIVLSSNAHDILVALHHMDKAIPVPSHTERLEILATVPVTRQLLLFPSL